MQQVQHLWHRALRVLPLFMQKSLQDLPVTVLLLKLHHSHSLTACWHCRSIFFDICNNRLSCKQCRSNTCCVLQSTSCNLCRIKDSLRLPCLHISRCRASKPIPGSDSLTLLMITAPSRPAFAAIWNSGASSAFRIMFAPVFSSPSKICSKFCNLLWKRGYMQNRHLR